MPRPIKEIREQLIRGDQSYLELVFKESYAYTVGFLKTKRYASEEEAHDTFIDAIMILRDKIVSGNIESISNYKTLMVGICINLNKEMLYKKYRASEKEEEVRQLFYDNGYSIDEDLEEENQILKKICEQVIKTLGEQCQELLKMYHYEGLSMTEIAEVMGFASANVAKTLKSRCFQKLVKKANKLRTLIK